MYSWSFVIEGRRIHHDVLCRYTTKATATAAANKRALAFIDSWYTVDSLCGNFDGRCPSVSRPTDSVSRSHRGATDSAYRPGTPDAKYRMKFRPAIRNGPRWRLRFIHTVLSAAALVNVIERRRRHVRPHTALVRTRRIYERDGITFRTTTTRSSDGSLPDVGLPIGSAGGTTFA